MDLYGAEEDKLPSVEIAHRETGAAPRAREERCEAVRPESEIVRSETRQPKPVKPSQLLPSTKVPCRRWFCRRR